jgi:outer membrane protein TolC
MNYRNYSKINFIRNIYLLTFLLIVIIGNYGKVHAQTITLKRAIDSAVLNYPELKARKLQIESSKMSLSDAKDQRLPSLYVSDQVDIGTANSLDGSYFGMGLVPSTSGSIRPENNMSQVTGTIGVATMYYELYNFGLNKARIENAKSLINVNTADYNKESYLLEYQIAQLYFDLLRYKLLTDVQQKNIDRYRVLYSYIKAYTSSGIKAGVDSSVANAEISKAKIQYIQTLSVYNKLKAQFQYYTGVRNANFDIDTNAYHLSDAMINQIQTNVNVDTVATSNPLLAFYKSRWDFALAQEKLVKKSFLPKLDLIGAAWTRGSSLTPNDAYGDLANGLNYDRYNYMGGLALTYNLVDIIHQKDKASIIDFQAQAFQEEMNGQKFLLENQLQQADVDIHAALDRLKEVPIQLKAAQDAFSQKSAQYNAGLVNIAELTDVSYLLFSAETAQVGAKTDLLNTLLQKAITNNTLTIFLNQFNY